VGAFTAMKQQIIFFDGVCNLCNGAVQFIIKRDTKKTFQFASLQSAFAHDQLKEHQIDVTALQSIVLKSGNTIYTKSTAALRIAKQLSGGWPLLYSFMIIPAFIRDWVYDGIAKNRYRWFGKQDVCMVPTPDLKDRFLD
jgi:predicted DCC family thiol-disulfide oxidoreductase YuxK